MQEASGLPMNFIENRARVAGKRLIRLFVEGALRTSHCPSYCLTDPVAAICAICGTAAPSVSNRSSAGQPSGIFGGIEMSPTKRRLSTAG